MPTTPYVFAAGDIATAARLNTHASAITELQSVLYAIKPSNQTVVNSTTQVNDADIVFALPANRIVHVAANLAYQDTVTNFGIGLSWSTTGTLSCLARFLSGVSPNTAAGTPAAVTIGQYGATGSLATQIYAGTTINSTYFAHEELIIPTGASGGTLQLKFACGFAGTNTVSLMAGSFAVVRYIA